MLCFRKIRMYDLSSLGIAPQDDPQRWQSSKLCLLLSTYKKLTYMTKRDLNSWIMYHDLYKIKRLGFRNAEIAQYLVLDDRTVRKYLNIEEEEEYEQYLLWSCQRKKILSDYVDLGAKKLTKF